MAIDSTETFDGEGNERSDDGGLRSRAMGIASAVRKRGGNGRGVLVAGGLLLARAARTARRSKRQAAVQGLVGAALLGFGLRRRRSGRASGVDEPIASGNGEAEDPAAATAPPRQSDVQHQSETDPRATSGSTDVGTETDPDRESIQFTGDRDADTGSESRLDEEGARDSGLDDENDSTDSEADAESSTDESEEDDTTDRE